MYLDCARLYASLTSRNCQLRFFFVAVGYFLVALYVPHTALPRLYGKSRLLLFRSSYCHWIESVPFDDHGIKPLARPGFPLTRAGLKSESARYGPAPEEIPQILRSDYDMNGTIPIIKLYFNESYLGGKALVSNWSMEAIEKHRANVRGRQQYFRYDATPVYQALDAFANHTVRSKRGLVIGSEDPWLESFLLEYGADEVTTVEFGTIITEHPQLRAYTAKDFTMGFLHGDIEPYDFAFTYSSIEHDGLGRYGDVLNPSGDLETMAKMLSVVKPGGFLFFGAPCCVDALQWNAHRIYGRQRYNELFAGWRMVGVFPNETFRMNFTFVNYLFQPVLLVQNTFGCENGEPVGDIVGLFKSFKV